MTSLVYSLTLFCFSVDAVFASCGRVIINCVWDLNEYDSLVIKFLHRRREENQKKLDSNNPLFEISSW